MSVEPIGLATLAVGSACLLLGLRATILGLLLAALFGAAAALIVGSANIQPGHVMIGFLAAATLTRRREAAAFIRALRPQAAGFWFACLVLFGIVGAYFLPRILFGVTYIVPRSEDCVLGGTAEEGRWDTEPAPETAASILRRCAALEPRLGEAEVLEHRVGLRPGRPQVRLELQELPDGTPLVHNYGHGGSGVTISWGCAGEAAGLARRALG